MSCPECVTGFIHNGTPKGTEVKVGGINAYTVGLEDSKRVIVFGTDIFGWRLVNARLLADEYASKGFRVVIPDLFSGMFPYLIVWSPRYLSMFMDRQAGNSRNGP